MILTFPMIIIVPMKTCQSIPDPIPLVLMFWTFWTLFSPTIRTTRNSRQGQIQQWQQAQAQAQAQQAQQAQQVQQAQAQGLEAQLRLIFVAGWLF